MEQNNLQSQNSDAHPSGAPIMPSTTQSKDASSMLIHLRTMKDDVADAIKRQHETLVTISLAEEKKKLTRQKEETLKVSAEHSPAPIPKRFGRSAFVVIVISVLVGIGVGVKFFWPNIQAVFIAMTTREIEVEKTPKETPIPEKLVPALIRTDTERRFITDKQTYAQITSAVAEDRRLSIPEGTIKNFSFESTNSGDPSTPLSLSINQLFSFLNTPVPQLLSRALETPFMAGLFGETSSLATPFVILKVSNKDIAVAGMLDFENTLPTFVNNIFGTTLIKIDTPKVKFRTVIISGRDARILENSSGVIVYAFADLNTVVIAQSKITLEKLLVLAKGE